MFKLNDVAGNPLNVKHAPKAGGCGAACGGKHIPAKPRTVK